MHADVSAHDTNIIHHVNYFRVFFKREDAYQLLRFALFSKKPRAHQPYPGTSVSNLCVCVDGISHEYAETMRLLGYNDPYRTDNEGVVDACVSVDLCRPYHHSIHTISIYDGEKRFHSNALRNDITSQILKRMGMLTWYPKSSSERTQQTPDFVVISNARRRSFPWCIEGIAVEANSPVAIRVDISSKNQKNPSWIPVAGGAVLRAVQSVNVRTHIGPNEGHAILSVQLIPFPEPFWGVRSQSVRVTIVESNGQEVGVSLLIARSKKNYTTPTTDSVMDIECTNNFDTVDDYRDWWYRLQAVRNGVQRAVPAFCEINRKLNDALNEYDNGRCQTEKRTIEASRFDRYDKDMCMPFIYMVVYGFLLAIAFPSMLAINLDHIDDTHTNVTTHYTMVDPDPGRVLRTMCWHSPSGPRTPIVPWLAVFLPFLFAAVFALVMIVLRGIELRKIHQLAIIARAEFQRYDQKLKAVYAEGRARIQAIASAVSSDPKVRNTVEAAILDHTSDNDNRMKNRKLWSVASNEHFGIVHVFFMSVDLVVLIICAFGLVAYVATEWCRVHSRGSDETAVWLFIYVILCAAADVIIFSFISRYKLHMHVDTKSRTKVKRITMAVAITVVVQQLLLLLELFTFFHKVSFVLVFSPLLIIIALLYRCACGSTYMTLSIFLAPFIASVVLMMIKVDIVFGIGTALLLGEENPEAFLGPAFRSRLTWVVTMIPAWLVFLLLPLTYITGLLEGEEHDNSILVPY